MNLVATSFSMQPVYNAARAAHALRLDQYELCTHTKMNYKHRQKGIMNIDKFELLTHTQI
jgi:hypothetical protein